jgi:hypothetical protein
MKPNPMPLVEGRRAILYDQQGVRRHSGIVEAQPLMPSFAAATTTNFHSTGIHVRDVSFYLEPGPAKAWRREVAVSPELVTDGGALETVAVGLAMHNEAKEGTIHVWVMRVLPALEGDDMIRLWLCGSAVPKRAGEVNARR